MINSIFQSANLSILNNLNSTQSSISKNLQRMSSGLKIINAKDDAAGCVISTNTSSKLSGLNAVQKNVQTSSSMLNIALDSLENMESIALRIRDLSLQSMNGTYSYQERQAMQDEINELNQELYRVKNTTKFNKLQIFGTTEKAPEIITNNTVVSINSAATPIAYSLRSIPMMMSSGDADVSINSNDLSTIDSLLMSETTTSSAPIMMRAAAPAPISEPVEIEISSAQDLKNLTNITGKVILKNDIDLTGIDIGGINIAQDAIFDGNGYTITGFNGTQALFNTNNGTIRNLNIKDAKVNASGNYGAILTAVNNGLIENCNISGKLSGYALQAGLVAGSQSNSGVTRNVDACGQIDGGTICGFLFGIAAGEITNCNVLKGSSLNSKGYAGGIAAAINYCNISNCSVSIDINNSLFCGGMAAMGVGCIIENCETSGSITSTTNANTIGGFVGNLSKTTIKNSKSNIDILYIGNNRAGGFVGYAASSDISNCSATGDVSGQARFMSGFAGTSSGVNYLNCYSTGSVTNSYSNAAASAAGFTSWETDYGTVTNCYSMGDVTCDNGSASGFVHQVDDTLKVENCFSSGTVTAPVQADSFCNTVSNNIVNCYSSSNQSGNVTNKNSGVTQKEESWFKTGTNLTFMGNGYDYRYNPPRLIADSTYINLQVGEEAGLSNTVSIDTAFELGEYSAEVTTEESACDTLKKTDSLISKILKMKSDIGATLNRLDSISQLQDISITNLSQTNSLITDTDISKEAVELVKNNILSQVSTAIFTQANQQNTNYILGLLKF